MSLCQSSPTRAIQQAFFPSSACWVALDCGTLLQVFKFEFDDASKIGSWGPQDSPQAECRHAVSDFHSLPKKEEMGHFNLQVINEGKGNW